MKIIKKALPLLILSLLIFPVFAAAHGPESASSAQSGSEMMNYIGDRFMGEETHEEMENLMNKMMEGNLENSEVDRLTELMNEYPGPSNMMMTHMWKQNSNNRGMGPMMNSGFMPNLWGWMMFLGGLVWLMVGVLLAIVLTQKVLRNGDDN